MFTSRHILRSRLKATPVTFVLCLGPFLTWPGLFCPSNVTPLSEHFYFWAYSPEASQNDSRHFGPVSRAFFDLFGPFLPGPLCTPVDYADGAWTGLDSGHVQTGGKHKSPEHGHTAFRIFLLIGIFSESAQSDSDQF